MMYLRYLSYFVRHKWWVFLAGRRVRAPLWRLLVHDLSKLRPRELIPYARFFYGPKPSKEAARAAALRFRTAWNHHQKANDHHWQYWCMADDNPREHKQLRFVLTSPDECRDFQVHEMLHVVEDGAVHWIELAGRIAVSNCNYEYRESTITDGGGVDRNRDNFRVLHRLVQAANRFHVLPMPEAAIREMVADWMGAGRTITGTWEASTWYEKHRDDMVLHPETRARVEALLEAHA